MDQDRPIPARRSDALRRTGITFLLATLAAVFFATAAAVRVTRIVPPMSGLGLTALALLYPILILVPGFIVLAGVVYLVTWLVPRLPMKSPDPDPEAADKLGLETLSLIAVNAAPKLLLMPLRVTGKLALIPVLSVQVYRYVLAFTILIAAEMVLTAASLVRRRDSLWLRWKVVLDAAWCVGLLWLITGPNLLAGDPLEWAAALGSSSIPQGWLIAAPRSLETWWPALQIILSVTLLTVLFRALRDSLLLIRTWKEEKRSAREKAA